MAASHISDFLSAPEFLFLRINEKQKLRINELQIQNLLYRPSAIIYSQGPDSNCHFFTDISTDKGWIRANDRKIHLVDNITRANTNYPYIIMMTRSVATFQVSRCIQGLNPYIHIEASQKGYDWVTKNAKDLSNTLGLKGLRNDRNDPTNSKINAMIQMVNCLNIGKSRSKQISGILKQLNKDNFSYYKTTNRLTNMLKAKSNPFIMHHLLERFCY